ncbi:tRNA (uridine(54)-C5)-methyltransferase TrmA [Dongshaea marina]|uniref:tRNA (uridine(54)-C5)-methyltransferase TrmA n=1 Tax=Dongshaea marina TaxID=2047966 RepID=UPI000D3E979F|nr:tRNA (uridine(54)-C5)-methyltransferase TrmA [Dongshaea marina]
MTSSPTDANRYQTQLQEKAQRLELLFADFKAPELEVFESVEENYRLRAEFRVWHEGEDLYYIMFDQKTREAYRVDQFPAASALINELMPRIIDGVKEIPALRRKLFQVDFLSTLSGEILVSLLYHRQLDDEWQKEIHQLKDRLGQDYNIDFVGRARKQKICIERDYVIEKLDVDGQELIYKQMENSFTQPNGVINQKMLGWALDSTQGCEGDLLELYCGNGNFSLALAKNFRKVLATEISKSSVASAQYNIAQNQIDNVTILRMSSEEFTEAMNGVRSFRRLKDIDLSEYQCETVLVDPPRAGLDDDTLKMIQQYSRIVYISCNPDTLHANLQTLSQTHKIERFALFDQFPYTHHMEAGVVLTRK